ncbi:MAG TPA: MOSC N-terminal beta barrel domain-containing protein [Nocardioides sp.]|uniref:MOSC domain-containing protein n=1 Tax=Nocardioides sp. TaxID=35761 RepID=UPI002E32F0A6|nr:MOSC N-terminal beta barrel domain-containing protein [Nocardioides sp.]HEX5086690.1 MOSC N-terminal beta barrel domain-containing protein [Nocardioides sp.]
MSDLHLSELRRYPVKSCRGQQLETAVVEPWGLAGDRRWMLVDDTGETVTAREHREMLLIAPRLRADGGLEATAPPDSDLDDLVVQTPLDGRAAQVSVFGRAPFAATEAGAEAEAWFSKVLGEPVRLVFADDPNRRQANPEFAGPGVPMHFGDAYPLLLATEASLAALNELIAAGPRADEGPLPMVRFRPNLVVAGGRPWAEDGWRRLRVGAAEFRVVKGCDRCAIPTTDEQTAVRRKEPTYTLAQHRRWDGAVWFGMNLVPVTPGATLHVGDEVTVLDEKATIDGPPR